MSKSNHGTQSQPFRVYTGASVGQAIRHYRLQSGLTQAQLAHIVGISPSYLSRLEHGQETEQLRRIVAILKQLRVRMTIQHADW